MSATRIVIIGAGPVGLAAALLLAKEGLAFIDVYEGRDSIPNNPEESYPIGINPRALHCLRSIDPALEQQALRESCPISAWEIYGGGTRRVARLDSGTVHGTTRGGVNTMLYERARTTAGVTIHFNHSLRAIDWERRALLFGKREGGGEQITTEVVCGADTRVLAADGLHSGVRRAIERQFGDFQSSSTPWASTHRVLFSQPGRAAPVGMDPSVHYIFSGCYAATIRRDDGREQWTMVMGASQSAPPHDRALMVAEDVSEANVEALRAMISARAPQMAPMFVERDDAPAQDELRRFFSRRAYRGAVVRVSRLNQGEFIALLGDAAHSVLPATGEGINSGLEDCTALIDALRAATGGGAAGQVGGALPPWFERFNALRYPDVCALGQLAEYLNEQQSASGARFASMLGFTICRGMLKGCGCFDHSYEDLTFGPRAVERLPYADIIAEWQARKCCILNGCACCCYPTCFLVGVLTLPCWLPRRMFEWCCAPAPDAEQSRLLADPTLRPPVGSM